MLSKVNIIVIVSDHVRTLKDDATGRYHWSDFVWFLGFPLATMGGLLYFYGNLDQGLVTIVATVLSIFAALLFNVLMLVYDALGKKNPNQQRLKFLRELANNISFAILVAMATIVSVLASIIASSGSPPVAVASGLTYFLATMFLLTLLMILKRTHVLLAKE